jgi:hypothetical protein
VAGNPARLHPQKVLDRALDGGRRLRRLGLGLGAQGCDQGEARGDGE